MSLYKNKYRIESARMRGHDYGSPGEYFVTINTKGMKEWFGEVRNAQMVRNEIGEIARRMWMQIPNHHTNVTLDSFVIMPNHVHGIVVLHCHRGSDVACNVATKNDIKSMSTISPKRGSLGAVIRSYKSAVTNWCHTNDQPDFAWQPRYHDHVIRNDRELSAIREYIENNPMRWDIDRNNPTSIRSWID